MTAEVADMIDRGEAPGTSYSTAQTEAGLAEMFRQLGAAWAIAKDLPPHSAFSFCRYAESFAFRAGWPDENGKYVEVRKEYPTPEAGIASFRFNGKPLLDVIKGARFHTFDMPFFI